MRNILLPAVLLILAVLAVAPAVASTGEPAHADPAIGPNDISI